MQTLNAGKDGFALTGSLSAEIIRCGWRFGILIILAFFVAACRQDLATEAMDTDANGYLCLKCGVKLYTDRTVFIGPQCPKCHEELLMNVVGYSCEKDGHLTIRPRRGDLQAPVCEQCKSPLNNTMRSPREKDLKAWGAAKFSS